MNQISKLNRMKVPATENELPVVWDKDYRPGIYSMLADQSKTFKKDSSDIVFLGDSFTYWGNWPERLHNLQIKNRGVPGDITFGVLDRLAPILDGHPSKIFILIGVNDIARNIPDAIILKNYELILSQIQLKSPKTEIILQSIFPTNPYMPTLADYKTKKQHIIDVNKGIKEIVSDKKLELLDVYSLFVDEEGYLPEKYTWDGLHLTELAYEKWTEILLNGHYLEVR